MAGLREFTADIIAGGGVLASEDESRPGVLAALADGPEFVTARRLLGRAARGTEVGPEE